MLWWTLCAFLAPSTAVEILPRGKPRHVLTLYSTTLHHTCTSFYLLRATHVNLSRQAPLSIHTQPRPDPSQTQTQPHPLPLPIQPCHPLQTHVVSTRPRIVTSSIHNTCGHTMAPEITSLPPSPPTSDWTTRAPRPAKS